jgi:transposase
MHATRWQKPRHVHETGPKETSVIRYPVRLATLKTCLVRE